LGEPELEELAPQPGASMSVAAVWTAQPFRVDTNAAPVCDKRESFMDLPTPGAGGFRHGAPGRNTMTEKYRVLAVDDNEECLELIRITLEPDYNVVTLSHPTDLYEILEFLEPDLLILDVMMPRITGFQITEILRKNPSTRDLPIIILSAKSSANEIKHGYRLGATMYLTKPFQPERLLRNIQTQFEMHPPTDRRKSLPIEEVASHLELRPAFLKGHLQLGATIPRKDKTVDPRKLMANRIRMQQPGGH
jgi:DNA-binding response OmpR family regulator